MPKINDPAAFGLAAHFAFHALVDRMIQAGIVSAEDVRIALLQAMTNAQTHEWASPFPDVATQAYAVLSKDREIFDGIHPEK